MSANLPIPAEFAEIAAICVAAEGMIGNRPVLTVNARDLHAGLQVRRDFSNWIKGRISRFGFVEHQDFESYADLSSPDLASPKARAQETKEYRLTLDMAKELSMVENNEKGRLARRYFIWREQQALSAQPYKVPQTYAAALLEAGRLALENERLTAECEALLPRAEAHDRLSAADGSLSVTEAAKALKIKPKTLFAWLSRNGWIYRRAGSARWLGYQAHTSNGDLEHKTTTITCPDGSEKITEQVRVTAKGLTKLAKIARDKR